jgi:hypothetical protein
MLCRLSQLGSAVMTMVGLLAIAASLVALAPNAFANEPVVNTCAFPTVGCSYAGEDCNMGTCDSNYNCGTQCSCIEEDGSIHCHFYEPG